MDKIFEISREQVESMASEKFKAIKLQDDLFIIPGNIASSQVVDENYVNAEILTEVIKDRIYSLQLEEGDNITINCEAELANEKKVMEVINLRNEITIEFDYYSSLNHEKREELVNTIASVIEDKKVIVSYYLPYDFEEIKNMVLDLI